MSFQNKLKGCIVGYAIGDALGRGTEFMTEREVSRRYPEGLHDYSAIIRDAHRSRWRRGDYTHTTQIVMELIDSIIETRGIDYHDYARRLQKWFGRQEPSDFDTHMRHVLQHPDFPTDPHETCRTVYELQGFYEAPNEALGRAMIIGLWPGEDTERLALENCRLTHWDSRCQTCCVIAATVSHELLWHHRMADYDHLIGIADRLDPEVTQYIETAYKGSIDDFRLDDEETCWFVRKNLGVALWSLWHSKDAAEAMYDVISRGGDADSNASLTMGLMGLKYGENHFPPHLVEHLLRHSQVEATALRLGEVLLAASDLRDTDEKDF
ncbi:MAG: ADP-ribosylglycohydrolase family protein [Bacteroides sp.]|nr:ADP-ribosylglycohydrolase family protein [Bacteroides sp.]